MSVIDSRATDIPLPRAARQRALGDVLFLRVTQFFALPVLGVVALAFLTTGAHAWPALRAFGLGFLVHSTWNPVTERFGAWPFVWGTLYSSFLALLLAVPVGVGAAIFLAELSPAWLSGPVSF